MRILWALRKEEPGTIFIKYLVLLGPGLNPWSLAYGAIALPLVHFVVLWYYIYIHGIIKTHLVQITIFLFFKCTISLWNCAYFILLFIFIFVLVFFIIYLYQCIIVASTFCNFNKSFHLSSSIPLPVSVVAPVLPLTNLLTNVRGAHSRYGHASSVYVTEERLC